MRIQPGDPSIDWLALRPRYDRKKVVVVKGGAHRIVGTTTEEIARDKAECLPALRRTQALESDEFGNRKSETIVFRDGFLPYSHQDVTEAYKLSAAYRGSEVCGEKRMIDGQAFPIRARIESPAFDAHSVEMVLRVLPLTDEYVAELPVFHTGRGAEMVVVARVFGREALISSTGSEDAWKVKTDWDGLTQYYWIGMESRDLLRQVSELSEGMQLEFVR